MRRDLSMVRRLEKIEKEIGYCEIKLEKEQRLQAQAHFLRIHNDGLLDAIDRLLLQAHGMHREFRGDIGVAVPIAAYPGTKLQQDGKLGPMFIVRLEGVLDIGVDAGKGLPDRITNEE